jgi:hypothetical protein
MGRHSAPDDAGDDAVETDAPLAVLDLGEHLGRHSSDGDDFDQAHTQRIAIIDDHATAPVPVVEPAQPAQAQPDKKADKAAAKAAKQAERDAQKSAKQSDKQAAKTATKAERGESNTRADLRVLREQPAVRAQVIGAIIVSFLIYTVVLLVLGHTDKYLIWLWVPIVACGVLVGLVLDLAHRRARKRASEQGPTG